MTKKAKLWEKFLKNPSSLSYKEIESLLLSQDAQMIPAKGSHKKFKHALSPTDLIIPIHNNDCKDFYKKAALKWITKILT